VALVAVGGTPRVRMGVGRNVRCGRADVAAPARVAAGVRPPVSLACVQAGELVSAGNGGSLTTQTPTFWAVTAVLGVGMLVGRTQVIKLADASCVKRRRGTARSSIARGRVTGGGWG
jgi:hypothetical protein